MKFADFVISHKAIFWLITLLVIIGGVFSYMTISRFEDPEFTIKEALVITQYPGATPKEVEEEVSEPIETAIQELPQLKHVTSISQAGLSQITVEIKEQYTKNDLPQIWDELRRKVADMQHELPPGASSSKVVDDFGDVYGMFFALTGDGYTYQELKNTADDIKKQLLLVSGVAKVQITGDQQEQIFVDISRAQMAGQGISLEDVYQLLQSQNFVSDAGSVRVGEEYIRIQPTGTPSSVKDIGNLLILSPNTKKLIHLDDIATISRGFVEVPQHLVYYDGEPAISIGVSATPGSNVVKIGQAVQAKLAAMSSVIPAGMEMHVVYDQPNIVDKSVRGFMFNVVQALVIVIIVLVIFMGMRSGMIVAAILLLTVLGTLFLMLYFNIPLQRISLGALIIALGMMVDNAIVVIEGIQVKMENGEPLLPSANTIIQQTAWPLLAATFVGILAFAPIGLSQDSTGEYMQSLFYVILISLVLSWLWAITIAPLLCYYFMKPSPVTTKASDPYQGWLYIAYKSLLTRSLQFPKFTSLLMLGLLALSIVGFGFIKPGFFPDSTTPIFMVDYWRTQGTDIRSVQHDLSTIEQDILGIEGVTSVSTFVGQGGQRFTLVYAPEKMNPSYSQLLIKVKDYRQINTISTQVMDYLHQRFPYSETKLVRIQLGPGGGSKLEVRFSGPDGHELRQLSNQAKRIMESIPGTTNVRDDWRQRVKVITPVLSEANTRRTGINRETLSDALQTAFTGKQVGLYRENDELIPIVSRLPDEERLDIKNIDDLRIWSPLLNKTVAFDQLVSDIKTTWENAIIHRRDRLPTITAMADELPGYQAGTLFQEMRAPIEAIQLPNGYKMEWGGEYESSTDAQAALFKNIPLGFLAMFVLLVILFNSISRPLVIWMCVPLAIIGVTVGLLVTHKAFEFVALLGFLSLTGMLIKNAVVLVDQIDLEIREGKEAYDAIMSSCLGRMRPVLLAAVTTVLGMIPLLFDAFFVSMAVVIIFGLSFATVLTLIVIPVWYQMFLVKDRNVNVT